MATGAVLGSFIGHDHVVTDLKISDSKNRIYSGSHDRSIKIWDLETRVCLSTLNEGGRVNGITILPMGNIAAAVEGQQHNVIYPNPNPNPNPNPLTPIRWRSGGRLLNIWKEKGKWTKGRWEWSISKSIEAFQGEGHTNPKVAMALGRHQLVMGCGVRGTES